MYLPDYVSRCIQALEEAGFAAYAVGGCVRDACLGLTPHDYDLCTAALPEQTEAVFAGEKLVLAGKKHGTVGVVTDGGVVEITTFRTEGNYTDCRRPDEVKFVKSLKEDLARRDFTVNAMAYHPEEGIVDPFGGQQDLKDHVLRCVGDAHTRFTEDALRIARLVRFASVLGFHVASDTAHAAHTLCGRLSLVAAERKRVELMKLIVGDNFLQVALTFPDVLCRLVPALSSLVGFAQHNPHHEFDVYTHTVRAVHAAVKDPVVRLAVLLHDLGKPATFFLDEQGVGHFYGHPAVSETLAKEALADLRFDNATVEAVLPLVRAHDKPITDDRRQIKRYLSKLGKDTFLRLLHVKEADAMGCRENSLSPDFSVIRELVDEIYREQDCLTLRDLAVNGNDLLALGIPAGPALGHILGHLLDAVLDERCDNEYDALTALAKECAENV